MAEQAKKTTKTAAKRKPAGRKPVARKPAAKRKPAARKTASKKSNVDFAARAQEAGRNAFLASLGFYGMAFDQATEQLDGIQEQLETRRKKADKTYKELVKRGKKVEKKAKGTIDDLDLDNLTDRKKLDAQLKKAKARFEDLRDSVSFKKAA